MSQKQRDADVAFMRAICAETQVGSAKVAMAIALDRLEKEPLVGSLPKVTPPAEPKKKKKPAVEKPTVEKPAVEKPAPEASS